MKKSITISMIKEGTQHCTAIQLVQQPHILCVLCFCGGQQKHNLIFGDSEKIVSVRERAIHGGINQNKWE